MLALVPSALTPWPVALKTYGRSWVALVSWNRGVVTASATAHQYLSEFNPSHLDEQGPREIGTY